MNIFAAQDAEYRFRFHRGEPSNPRPGLLLAGLIVIALALLAVTVHAATIKLTWTPPTKWTDGKPIVSTITYTVHDLLAADAEVYRGTGVVATVTLNDGALSAWVVRAWVNGLASKPSTPYVKVPPLPNGPTAVRETK